MSSYAVIRAWAQRIWDSAEDNEEIKQLSAKLALVNDQIKKIASEHLFRCTYVLKDYPKDIDLYQEGGYVDYFFSANQFEMKREEEEEGEGDEDQIVLAKFIPMPNRPGIVTLSPEVEVYEPPKFFTDCMVEGCYNRITGLKGKFLVCDKHVSQIPNIDFSARILDQLKTTFHQAEEYLKKITDLKPEQRIDIEVDDAFHQYHCILELVKYELVHNSH